MKLSFKAETIACYHQTQLEQKHVEQTQDIRLPEEMPDVGRVLCAWGQVLLRGKEWREGLLSVSGGITVWAMYLPEDGSGPRTVQSWLPFQARWELPGDLPEGAAQVRCLLRYADARSTSARKILLRGCASLSVSVFCPGQAQVHTPGEDSAGVELLKRRYPMQLWKEAGEKLLSLDEELTVPSEEPQPQSLFYATLQPRILECRVLGDKIVFRGQGTLHCLYQDRQGDLHSRDLVVPISQYGELGGEYGGEGAAEVALCVTALETDLDEEGRIRLKAGITAQYAIRDVELVTLVEDAYAPGREVILEQEVLTLPGVLEHRRELMTPRQRLPGLRGEVVDLVFLPEQPRIRRTQQGVTLTQGGQFQALSLSPEGNWETASPRWEGTLELKADGDSRLTAVTLPPASLGFDPGEGSVTAELPLEITAYAGGGIPMVTGVELGQKKEEGRPRPSLILCRAGEKGLWQMAKENGSTVAAILQANGLEAEPAPGKLLLIPVC